MSQTNQNSKESLKGKSLLFIESDMHNPFPMGYLHRKEPHTYVFMKNRSSSEEPKRKDPSLKKEEKMEKIFDKTFSKINYERNAKNIEKPINTEPKGLTYTYAEKRQDGSTFNHIYTKVQ